MVISHTATVLVTGLVLSNLCLADETSPISGFRSELWRMEYREKDEDEQSADEDADPEDASDKKVAPDPDKQLEKQDLVSAAVTRDSVEIAAPGQPTVNDLNAETPFADWQIEEGVAVSGGQKKYHSASAWQLSQIGRRAGGATPLSKGPSMVTFLVAIVACVVVTGALFSGRE